MVANRRSGIRQYTPFASIFAPRFFSSKKAWQSQQSESLFSLSSLTMSNGSSKDKLVLYNPVTLKFWACRNWQFRKMQKKKKEKRKKLWIEDEQNFTNYYTLAPLSQSLTQKWVELEMKQARCRGCQIEFEPNNRLIAHTKVIVYRAWVQCSFLCGSKSWKCRAHQER